MKMIDFTPLFRTAIGFDRLANALEMANRVEAGGYPPYDIEVAGEDRYRITMAVAGFSQDELDIEVKENLLRVAGAKRAEDAERRYLHRGIAQRSFERTFQLADYVRVASAELKDGLLHIGLQREVPEALKPRRIAIQTEGSERAVLEGKSEAA
jgi:molecular chaperone IbpA